jgi:hypothetical protein
MAPKSDVKVHKTSLNNVGFSPGGASKYGHFQSFKEIEVWRLWLQLLKMTACI